MRLLTVNYSGTSFYEEKLIFRENAYDIVKILGDKNNIFILSQNGIQYCLRCFKLSTNDGELIPTGTILNID